VKAPPVVFYSVLSLAGATALNAYVREYNNREPLKRSGNVTFLIGPTVKAGLQNNAGSTIITPDSDPSSALAAAMNAWNTVPGGNLNLSLATVGGGRAPAADNVNIITFDDTPENRSIVGSAVAVTYYYYLPAQSVIIDSDIVFNPDMTFATTPTLGAFDLQAIATHELGHAIGAGHTPYTSATMFPYSMPEDSSGRNLSSDDRAFVHDAFPRDGPFGGIRGSITTPSGGFPASAVVLVLSKTGVCAAPYTSGSAFSTGGLPDGDYTVVAFPLPPFMAGSGSTEFETPDWQPTFYGGATARTVSVSSGIYTEADISVPDGLAQLKIDFATLQDGTFSFGSRIPSGGAVSATLYGSGFSANTKVEDIAIYPPGATVRAGSVHVTAPGDPTSFGELFFVLDVPARADWADAAIVVRSGDLSAVYADMRIAPAQPGFTPSGVVNAASFSPGPLAPGEIVSIFGSNLGPDQGVTAALDAGGTLPTNLGDTTVEMGDRRVPLLYVSSTQINAQVPFEFAERATSRVRVRRGESIIEAILPVAAASPAVFGGIFQPAIVNEDASLNTAENPAVRGRPIVVYGTGQGVVDPPLASGKIAPLSPLSRSHNVTATIGDQQARVEFAGLAPGFVGLWQVNAVVPQDAPAGFVPLVLVVNDSFSSGPVYLYVQ